MKQGRRQHGNPLYSTHDTRHATRTAKPKAVAFVTTHHGSFNKIFAFPLYRLLSLASMDLNSLIRDIPDSQPGIIFKDICPLIGQPNAQVCP